MNTDTAFAEELKSINKMTKAELQSELDESREELEVLRLRQEIAETVSKLVFASDLRKVRDRVGKIYEESIKDLPIIGLRDNLRCMAESLFEKYDRTVLNYLNAIAYDAILERQGEDAPKNLHMTDGMIKSKLEYMEKGGAA